MRKTYLRIDETMSKYMEHEKHNDRKCLFCVSESEREFKLWKIIKNDFPYDRIASCHKMLSPLRHVPDKHNLYPEEINELEEILHVLEKERFFDSMIVNFTRNRTIPEHYHIHLLKYSFE